MEELLLRLALSLTMVALAFWAKWRWSRQHLNRCAAKIPGPPTLPILGNALQFMCGTDQMLEKISVLLYKYGPVMKFWLGPELNVLVGEPKDIGTLLMSSKILNKGPTYKYMQLFLGQGLLTGSGTLWRNHRKIVNPAFHTSRLEDYLGTFNKHTTSMMKSLRSVSPNKEFNIFYEIVEATTNSVFETLLGYSKNNKQIPFRDELVKKQERMYEIVYMRMTKWWLQIDWLFKKTNLYKEHENYRVQVRSFSRAVLTDRLGEFEKICQLENSQLSPFDRLLKEANMSEEEMLDEVYTLFTSSQESSATIASFTLLMLAMHQDYQEKVYNEVINIIGTEDRDVTASELSSMVYLELALKEVLRLFPIGTLIQRKLYEDFEISTCTLPAGSSLVIPVYQIHRHPKYWEEPEKFNPYRFSPENSTLRHQMAYIPFSLGPMNCVGQKYANLVVKTICSRVVREFRVRCKATMSELKLKTDISVRPMNGYYVTLERRTTNNAQIN